MAKLRDQVYAADKSGQGLDQALKNLQSFVTSHMNTALSSGPNAVYPPIQLQYTYERLQKAQQTVHSDSQLYTQAENYCQQAIPNGFSGRYRVPCIEQYVQTHGVGGKVQPVPASLYEFDFVSPWWSPDLAGWSIVASITFFILFIISLFVQLYLKYMSK